MDKKYIPEDIGVQPNNSHSDSLAKAQELTQIASEHLKAVEFDIKAKLAEKNWTSVDEGLKFIETEKATLKEEHAKITKEKADNDDRRKELGEHIVEANQHRLKSNEILRQAEQRFQAAIQKEIESQARIELGERQIKELQKSIEYFNNYILPILDDLTAIKNAIYIEVERWQKNTSLKDIFNFVSLRVTKIERMLENVANVEIPEALKIKPPEQSVNNTTSPNPLSNQALSELAEQLKTNFTPIFNLFQDTVSIISMVGFPQKATDICQDLDRLDISFKNNFASEYDVIVEYFKTIAIDFEEIVLQMKNNQNIFKPNGRLAIEHNLDDIYELMPVLRPVREQS
jgi:hypothetical protein